MGKKFLIIPDVHGRDFWKEPVKRALEDKETEIVFLGDYLDPYPHEWENTDIDPQVKALEDFKKIIQLKKDNPNRITLLLGNHDCTYAISRDICDCRRDKFNHVEIANLFKNNRDLFQLAKEVEVSGIHIIFSHAGIQKGWVERVFGDEMNEDGFNIVNELNKAWETDHYGILNALGIYDSFRGWGGQPYGSPIWSDIRSWVNIKAEDTYGLNIVGHTMCSKVISLKTIIDIDCQKAFILTENGDLKEY